MKRKKSNNKRWLCTALTAVIVMSIFSVGIVPVSAGVASVTRDLPDGPVGTNEKIVVSLALSNFECSILGRVLGSVKETLPDDFTYVEGSVSSPVEVNFTEYNPKRNELKIVFNDNETTTYTFVVTYNVTTSSDPQTAVFAGTYKACVVGGFEEGAVDGEKTVEVKAPDTTPPYTSGHNPAKGATNVPIDTNIVVHVKDDDAGVDQVTIVMTVEGETVTPVITGSATDYTLTYDPPADFGYEQVVDVTIDAADLAATPNVMSTDEYSFTTQAEIDTTPPYTSGHDPAKDAPNVPIDTNIVVHVKDDGAGVDQATIVMTVEGVDVTSSVSITGSTADYTLTYDPPADFGYEQVVDVTIDAADLNATPNVMPQDAYSFTTQTEGGDTTPPVVSNPTATPQVIPEDTDNEPLWGELANLSVVVTDESAITSVTIDLSSIGGSAAQAMIPNGDNVWYYETNASVDSAIFEAGSYVPHSLQVTATDEHGYSNTSESIELTVMKNGDVMPYDGDGTVDFMHDALYLVRHTKGVTGYEDIRDNIADVTGDGEVDFMHDALYLVRHTKGVTGYKILK